MKIKLCGMRRDEDIDYLNEFLPDYAGFILSGGFKRSIDSKTFLRLSSRLNKKIKRVGVFVNEPIETVVRFAEELDVIQLHGDEELSYIQKLRNMSNCKIWKAVRVNSPKDIEIADKFGADMLLLDAFVPDCRGGTGKTVDKNAIQEADFLTDFFIAGGLNSENIMRIINDLPYKPEGADISSGIETDGFKDREKIREIINIVRSADIG